MQRMAPHACLFPHPHLRAGEPRASGRDAWRVVIWRQVATAIRRRKVYPSKKRKSVCQPSTVAWVKGTAARLLSCDAAPPPLSAQQRVARVPFASTHACSTQSGTKEAPTARSWWSTPRQRRLRQAGCIDRASILKARRCSQRAPNRAARRCCARRGWRAMQLSSRSGCPAGRKKRGAASAEKQAAQPAELVKTLVKAIHARQRRDRQPPWTPPGCSWPRA